MGKEEREIWISADGQHSVKFFREIVRGIDNPLISFVHGWLYTFIWEICRSVVWDFVWNNTTLFVLFVYIPFSKYGILKDFSKFSHIIGNWTNTLIDGGGMEKRKQEVFLSLDSFTTRLYYLYLYFKENCKDIPTNRIRGGTNWN